MSRSYREPWFVDNYGSSYKKWVKRQASKTVRRAKDVPEGNAYRKLFDSWNICDYKMQWDPKPHYYMSGGVMRVIEPTPEYKARMK
jgi:hypothetical protein